MYIAVGNVSFDDCDMLTSSFGWTGFLLPITAAGEFDRAIRDYLVGVHVRLSAAPGLPNSKWKMLVEFSSNDFVAGLND